MLREIAVIGDMLVRRLQRIGTGEKRRAGIGILIAVHGAPLTRR